MTEQHPQRTVTLNVTLRCPEDWSDADVQDIVDWRLDLSDHTMDSIALDVSAPTFEKTRVVTSTTTTPENWREPTEPTVVPASPHDRDAVRHEHPAFGMVSVTRPTGNPRTLHDSEIRHNESIRLTIHRGQRERSLARDWLFSTGLPLIEVEFSLVQWAAMISSMSASATPCTIRATQAEPWVASLAHQPRLQESMDEVSSATDKTYDRVRQAMAAYAEKKNAANLRALQIAIEHVEPNLRFVAKSLTEHTEAVVTKARADVEAMVSTHAERLGIDPDSMPRLALGSTQEEE